MTFILESEAYNKSQKLRTQITLQSHINTHDFISYPKYYTHLLTTPLPALLLELDLSQCLGHVSPVEQMDCISIPPLL